MEPSTGQLAQGLSPSGAGVGPLLQRDYWATLRGAKLRPSQLLAHLRAHFQSFAPEELAAFEVRAGRSLQIGDELSIEIFGAGHCAVRVVHQDAQSLTLATLVGTNYDQPVPGAPSPALDQRMAAAIEARR